MILGLFNYFGPKSGDELQRTTHSVVIMSFCIICCCCDFFKNINMLEMRKRTRIEIIVSENHCLVVDDYKSLTFLCITSFSG